MKKFLAVLLAVLTLVSVMSIGLGANAGDDEVKIYAVIYTKSAVPIMYEPTPTFRFDKPGWVTISADTPIAIDYDFVCWKDEDGNRWDPGDQIYVSHEVRLTPVFAPKTDNDSRTLRTIKAGFASLIRVLGKMFGFFKTLEDFTAAEPVGTTG